MQETEVQKRERHHQEDLQRLRGFRPIDDTFMRGLFKNNIPLAELVLRIIVGKPDLTLTKCETQADLKRVTGARSICLDAYATDSTGKKYDIEIQRSDNGADPHRARYHSSMMDVENLMQIRIIVNCRIRMSFSSPKKIIIRQESRSMLSKI